MANKLDQSTVLENFRKAHGGKYDYSLVVYDGWSKPVKITCPEHGVFEQHPSRHATGHGCRECGKDAAGKVNLFSQEEAVAAFRDAHGGRYDYSLVEYTKMSAKVKIVCPQHGVFEQKAALHRKGNGCKKCGDARTGAATLKSQDQVLKEFVAAHGDRYDYSKVRYEHTLTAVRIICPEHGAFDQKPYIHRRGHGCPECMRATQPGFTKGDFVKRARKGYRGQGRLYVLQCLSGTECFHKVGMTLHQVKRRFQNRKAMPYSYRIVTEICGLAGEIYDLEKLAHERLAEHSYSPRIKFPGHTECFAGLTDQEVLNACKP